MSFNNPNLCEVCGGRDFELVSGFHYCQTQNCGEESSAEPGEFGEDTDSNDENNRRNDYSDEEDLLQSDNEESIGKVII